MSSQFQNRLVGTVVLVALGVIFLPDLLDGKKDRVQEEFAEIPLRPDIKVMQTPEEAFAVETLAPLDLSKDIGADETKEGETEPEKSASEKVREISQDRKSAVTKTAVTKTADVPTAEAQAVATANKQPEPKAALKAAWTLQLGAFSNADNVDALVGKLRQAGFKAYTLPSKPVDGTLTRVFVGPDVSQAQMERIKREVAALTSLDGKVIAFNPLER